MTHNKHKATQGVSHEITCYRLMKKRRVSNGTNYRNNPHFTHAIKKYGWDEENSMYMIEDAYGDREKLCEFEEYLKKGNIYENPELLEG